VANSQSGQAFSSRRMGLREIDVPRAPRGRRRTGRLSRDEFMLAALVSLLHLVANSQSGQASSSRRMGLREIDVP
jgi:hypothetical protein